MCGSADVDRGKWTATGAPGACVMEMCLLNPGRLDSNQGGIGDYWASYLQNILQVPIAWNARVSTGGYLAGMGRVLRCRSPLSRRA